MQDIGHSSLLKFFVKTMSEKNIESNVPGEHNIREVSDGELKEKETLTDEDKAQSSKSNVDKQNQALSEGHTSEIATADDFTLSPVITVTKKESTFTKGDLKLQKVTVTEDISHTSTNNDSEEKFNRRLTYEISSITQPNTGQNDPDDGVSNPHKEEKDPKRLQTKIPMSRLRQAVIRVKNDIREKKRIEKEKEIHSSARKSSIPRLKDTKIPPRDSQHKKSGVSKADEEFDRIFNELNPTEDISLEFLNTDLELSQIENSFEEIIHAYEENITQTNNTEKVKQSRIPLLKRKSDHEIVIPQKEKQALKKSYSVDTKIQSFNERLTEKNTSQPKIYTESNSKTEINTVQQDINEIIDNNNTVIIKKQTAVHIDNTKNEETNSNKVKETIKIATPVFDVKTTDISKTNEFNDKSSIDNEAEDLTQDITITKNLNFDKETVSMIYKIDFTENNFDSLDMTINESMKQDIDVTNNYKDSKISITKEVMQNSDFKTKTYQTESLKSTKIESNNYVEEKADKIETVSEIKVNQTENNNISQEKLIQSVKTNERSVIEVDNQSSIKQASTETKSTKVNSKTSTLFTEATNTNYLAGTSKSVKATEEIQNNYQELLDSKAEFDVNETIIKVVSLEGSSIDNLTSESSINTNENNDSTKAGQIQRCDGETVDIKTSVRQVSLKEDSIELKSDIHSGTSIEKTSKTNGQEKLDKTTSGTENVEYYSSSKNSSMASLNSVNRFNISSIKSLKTNDSIERRDEIDKGFLDSFKTNRTIEPEITNDELSLECLKNKRSKSVKLEELSRRYENIDIDVNLKKISYEANKNVENKTTSNSSNDNSAINTNIRSVEVLHKDLLSTEDRNDSSKYVSISEENNKGKEADTNINNTKNSTTSYLNSELNKPTITNTKMTALNKTDTITRDVTKSFNLNTQDNEEINKIYSEVFTKMNAQNKQSFVSKEIINNKVINTTLDKIENNQVDAAMEENIPILKGKVNRVIRRINSIDTKPVEKNTNDLPKKMSILSKIQMFERVEPNEIYPKTRIPKLDSTTSRIPNRLRQTSTELRRPKIVKEIFKETNESKTENTAKVSQENTSNIVFKDEHYESIDANLKEEQSYKPSVVDTRLLIASNQVKDVKNINNKETEAEIRNESNETNKTFDKSNVFQVKTERNTELNDFEIINKGESTYTKIYTNNNSDKLAVKKIESFKMEETIEKSNKTSEDVFIFTPKEQTKNMSIAKDVSKSRHYVNGSEDLNVINKEINTTFINTESKARSLDFIQNSTRSYERLQSDYKDGREFDIRRTTSVAELEIGGVVKGRVYEMIMRINSMEISQGKREIQKEQPRKSSVSEKIALFEGKLPPIKTEKRKETLRMKNETEVAVEMTEEDYTKKIAELKNVKNNFEVINTEFLELRDTSEMPVIALGTALLDKRLIKHVVEAAIDMGYRAIDTAYIYGNEKEIGEAINNKINDGTVKREDLYIIAKLWSTYHRKDLVEKACRQSLDNMGLKYFDLYLVHNPMSLLEGSDPLPKIANVLQYSEHDYMDAWRGIEDLIIKGLVRRGGVSNFNSEQVHRVMEKGRIKPVVNQVECHPYLSQERLGGFCDAYGMRLSCYGVLGSKGTPSEHKSDLPPVIDDPLVLVMAAGLGVTPGQMLIAYQLHNSRSVVIKASSAGHLYDNLKAQLITLETSHLTALKSLNKNKRTYYLKGLGETHKNYPFNIAF